jgi:hypothetical protein
MFLDFQWKFTEIRGIRKLGWCSFGVNFPTESHQNGPKPSESIGESFSLQSLAHLGLSQNWISHQIYSDLYLAIWGNATIFRQTP